MDESNESMTSFRPSKRRKVFRRRFGDADNDDDDNEAAAAASNNTAQASDPNDSVDLALTTAVIPLSVKPSTEDGDVGDLVRVRKLRQQRKRGGGIGFGAASMMDNDGTEDASYNDTPNVLSDVDLAAAEAADMGARFAKQSGFKVEVDKHMMAYIDAEMARRKEQEQLQQEEILRATNSLNARLPNVSADIGSEEFEDALLTARPKPSDARGSSNISGLPQEVEISQQTGEPSDPNNTKTAARPRLGPDGKPWRGRRNRRTSDDRARDALVEALLSENIPGAPQHYQRKPEESGNRAQTGTEGVRDPGMNEDADERVAAAFVRQFHERDGSGRTRKKPPLTTQQRKDKEMKKEANKGLIANGPKLGGSRSQRAKMHAMEAERLKTSKK